MTAASPTANEGVRISLDEGIEEALAERNQAAFRQALAGSLPALLFSLVTAAGRSAGARAVRVVLRQPHRRRAGNAYPGGRTALTPTTP